jgi:DCC-interacting protein 13 alpha
VLQARFEANAELYVARKKFYQCTLDYISQLKEFQMRKRFMLLEPVLTFMHAQMGYFKACQEIMNSGFQQLLTNLNGDIQSYHSEHENEVRELQQQKTELELQFPTLCVPDPDLADPFTEFPTPNTGLSSKYGYLYLRIQKGGLAAKWERAFFFTKNGYLYTQSLQNVQRSFDSSNCPLSPPPPFSPFLFPMSYFMNAQTTFFTVLITLHEIRHINVL